MKLSGQTIMFLWNKSPCINHIMSHKGAGKKHMSDNDTKKAIDIKKSAKKSDKS